MSDSPEKPKPVDLSSLQMMPDWVTELGSEPEKEYLKFEEPAREGYRDRRQREGSRAREGGAGREQGGPRDGGRWGDRGGRREGGNRQGREPRRDREGGPGESRGPRGEFRGDHRRPPVRIPVPDGLEVEVAATASCLDALVSRIKMSGRAFGMFDLAKVVLAARDRFEVEFVRRDLEIAPRLYRSGEGEEMGLWLDRTEAAKRFFQKDALEQFYRMEETEVEPPKGEFKTVAVCGLSGQILGPPNHHSFQTAVLRLHRERYSKMPLAHYKSRIRTETDEELVNRWKEQQSRQIRYVYPRESVAGMPELILDSLDSVERHFLAELCEGAVQEVDRATVPGHIPGKLLSPDLLTWLRQEVEALQRNPFRLVKRLCGQLEHRGLKIFKRQGKKLFVSKARPRPLDPQVPLAQDVNQIVAGIRAHPGIKVSELVTCLAPRSSAHGDLKPGELTPQETAILTHLRWLIDEGFVIEYTSTALFLGVQSLRGSADGAAEEEPGAATEEEPGAATEEEPGAATEEEPGAAAEEEPGAAAEEEPGAATVADGVEEEVVAEQEGAMKPHAPVADAGALAEAVSNGQETAAESVGQTQEPDGEPSPTAETGAVASDDNEIFIEELAAESEPAELAPVAGDETLLLENSPETQNAEQAGEDAGAETGP